MRMIGAVIGFAFLGVLPSIAAGADPTYVVKLHRAEVVGQIYDVHDVFENTSVCTVVSPEGEPQTKTVTIRADLTGRVNVLAVDEKGDASLLNLTVKRLVRADGRDMMRPGTVIKLSRDDKTKVVSSSTGPVPDAAMVVVGRFFPSQGTSGKTVDDVYGSSKARKVGESWGIDTDAAGQKLFGEGLGLDPTQLKGRTVLKGVETVNDTPAFRVITSMTLPNLTLPDAVPPQVKMDQCYGTIEMNSLLPVDEKVLPIETKSILEDTITGHRTDTLVGVEIKIREVDTEQITPVVSPEERAAADAAKGGFGR
jgi:hypothetical protein